MGWNMDKEDLKDIIEKNKDELFSEIAQEINNDNVTDIEWDGYNLWITELGIGSYISGKELSDRYVENVSIKLANIMGVSFNRSRPILEANTEKLRISIWHESRCHKKSMAIRKIPEYLRFSHKDLVESDYAPESIINLLENSVTAHLSIVVGGQPHAGKTELVKALSTEMFDSTEPLIRLDMTEYMEKHSVARMIGSPPGYVGYDEAGQLTEKVRRHPYSVVLFDEIEKAHPDIMNILLQILDEGNKNDAHGRTVNFENTIIAMTSNAGSTDKSTGVGFNKSAEDISKEKAMKSLREFLRPEFLSRIDEVIVFKPLVKEDFERIAALMLDEMKEPLSEKGIILKYDNDALKAVAEKSFGKVYGARDIRRVIRKEIEEKIADIIIDRNGKVAGIGITSENGEIKVDYM